MSISGIFVIGLILLWDKTKHSLRVCRPVFRRAQVSKQGRHFIVRTTSSCLLVTAAGQKLANLLLVDPEQPMQSHAGTVTEVTLQLTGRLIVIHFCGYCLEEPIKYISNQASNHHKNICMSNGKNI